MSVATDHEGALAALRIERRFRLAAGIAIACLFVLGVALTAQSHQRFRRAASSILDLKDFRVLLDVANRIAAESSPAHNAMAEPVPTAEVRAALDQVRAHVDKGLAHARDAIDRDPHEGWRISLRAAETDLAVARRLVDEIRAAPADTRTLASIEVGIQGMFRAGDSFRDLVRHRASHLLQAHEDLFPAIFMGMALLEFRDHAGRSAASLVGPLALRQPIPLQNLAALRRAEGRLAGLWNLTEVPNALLDSQPGLRRLRQETEQKFLGEGLAFVGAIVDEGRGSGEYSVDVTEYTRRIVETFQPILRLQGATIDAAEAKLARKRDLALLMAGLTMSVVLGLVIVAVGAILYVQRRLLKPLIQARDDVVALAHERSPAGRDAASYAREFSDLFDAIDVLDAHLQERRAMTRELRRAALVDGLTGLMNRRALEDEIARLAKADLIGKTCLILIDVDNFKTINDRFGHAAGDQVARWVAVQIRSRVRASDKVARFGGDEFAVLIGDASLADAAAVAEDLCRTLSAAPLDLSGGQEVRVTASFGVGSDAATWEDLLERADSALYRSKNEGRNRVRVWSGS
ncbi:GGDEF domain-containing protein [Enterovirga rhinocerotis]|uniref:GGDEF domain-containing protein n=1 Tax=Enterovirga rhinocerotis TaxID=1339210 RepID=UPI00105DDCD2|nr:GGDEF domain-containing protein [Enterovirga rhinocerotis]